MADKKKILVAESTPLCLHYQIRLPEYVVELVKPGKELLQRLSRGLEGLDMLVLEANMGDGISGSEIAKRYQNQQPNFPVVVTSESPEKYESLKKANIPTYKPADAMLIDYIRKTLG